MTPGPCCGGCGWRAGCPYRGLRPYGPEDSRWFFGRDRAVSALVGRRAHPGEHPVAHRRAPRTRRIIERASASGSS
ncbi:hypothetical protein AB0K12_46720 [Nonomuraea sp. NPDC049419]|uniref:nSTAND1 domain-containing NTPase n=1 Tax=Nonomuraea sp. NPDC049419 TaxID=3155772 RepID=UPI00343F1F23